MKCICGHEDYEHVLLPGHPDGVQECQVGDCDCGQVRPWRRRFPDDDEEDS